MATNDLLLIVACAVVGFGLVWFFGPGSTMSGEPPSTEAGDPAANDHVPVDEQPPQAAPSWCDILLVEPDAGQAEIRQAYARVMKSIHPDTSPQDAATTARCLKVQRAYEAAKLDAELNGRP